MCALQLCVLSVLLFTAQTPATPVPGAGLAATVSHELAKAIYASSAFQGERIPFGTVFLSVASAKFNTMTENPLADTICESVPSGFRIFSRV